MIPDDPLVECVISGTSARVLSLFVLHCRRLECQTVRAASGRATSQSESIRPTSSNEPTNQHLLHLDTSPISHTHTNPMIRLILVQNRQGKSRLAKFYVPYDDEEQVRIKGEIHRLIAPRDQKYQSNFVEVSVSAVCTALPRNYPSPPFFC